MYFMQVIEILNFLLLCEVFELLSILTCKLKHPLRVVNAQTKMYHVPPLNLLAHYSVLVEFY